MRLRESENVCVVCDDFWVSRSSKTVQRLAESVGSDHLLRIRRRSSTAYTVDGFVLALGAKWVLIAQTTEGGFFDGIAALRLRSIKEVAVDTSFASRFARTRPEWPPRLPDGVDPTDLDVTSTMLRRLLQRGQLVAIERDPKDDARWIGVPDELRGRWLYLWEVTPQATWHEQPLGYRLRSITAVILRDRYQEGLAAIAGPPPARAGESW